MKLLLAGLFAARAAAALADAVTFDWFEYTGHDAVFETPLPAGAYRNPILAGFYPDPSVTRVGDTFYLVNSTFAYFPGIPVFASRDLVHWNLLGHVIDRPGQLDFDGLGLSRGVFAPDISFHDGTFYVINTAVDSGGNFYVTATNPAGPWSQPVWLPELAGGIDPSFFFDANGKAYVLNNGPPEGKPRYDGHRAIWIQEFDIARGKLVGPRKVILDGGVDPAANPIWIEGPHLYERKGWYYLMCAEGGTGPNHSEVVLRARSPWGPFVPYAGNPILTQRDLPSDRAAPVINAGHADLVEAADGSWWAVFLASRAYGGTHYNTGRETFLLPVTWRDEWPVILPHGETVPYVVHGLAAKPAPEGTAIPTTGNFTWRDEFDGPTLNPAWIYVRVPKERWADLTSRPGALTIHPRAESLDTLKNPSFLARRQQHMAFDASTSLELPASGRVAAGLAAFQNERYWYFLGARRTAGGVEVFLERCAGETATTVASASLASAARLQLKISANGAAYSFSYAGSDGRWRMLRANEDGTLLSTDVAGGFIGAVVGPYARTEQ
ncbi:MAG TPA: glycoside hydrolase family 43 protein [Steroidobacteraceae bacterium]|nr:glycoside hydrolase family 43 protein [Steroidobacteraceae bacterium]